MLKLLKASLAVVTVMCSFMSSAVAAEHMTLDSNKNLVFHDATTEPTKAITAPTPKVPLKTKPKKKVKLHSSE